ncbi:MAG: SCO2322 family protein, partial [Candidatus Phosphoribacter sp.]
MSTQPTNVPEARRSLASPATRHLPPARRRAPAAWAVVVLTVLAALAGAAPQAQAASFQYWSYWQLSGAAWTFAQKAADQIVPADGSVEGWRFAVADESSSRTPRVTPTFAQLCGSTPAQAGSKRVGLVVDFGRLVDGDGTTAPPAVVARCAVVAPEATGAQVLA